MRLVVIMRGVPGSGKSTWVQKFYPSAVVCSADNYRVVDGEYVYDAADNPRVHKECFRDFVLALENYHPLVVVDNTNITRIEFSHYMAMARRRMYTVLVKSMPHPDPVEAAARNIHGVPLEVITDMINRWEP